MTRSPFRPIGPEEAKTDPNASSTDALLTIVRAVSSLEDREQERVLNAACAYFGHYPVKKPGAIESEEN